MIALWAVAVAAVPGAFAGIPDVTIVTYPVRGMTVEAIRASLDAVRSVDRNDGEEVEAVSHWRFAWRWPGGANGSTCDLAAASVRFRATVTLPRLVGLASAPAEVRARWHRYRAALEEHEAGHVRYAWSQRGAVLAAIRGATCPTADAAGQAALHAIVEHDLAYDRDTRHGQTQGAVFP